MFTEIFSSIGKLTDWIFQSSIPTPIVLGVVIMWVIYRWTIWGASNA